MSALHADEIAQAILLNIFIIAFPAMQLGWELRALHKNWTNTWKIFFIRMMEV